MSKPLIEICCGSYEDVKIAEESGSERVELNQALFLGGLTPSFATVKLCIENLKIGIIPMVRPRSGGFCYSDLDFEVMKEDAKTFINLGVDGIAFGFLTSSGEIDKKRVEEFVKIIGEKDAVFHRAFDVAKDPLKAFEELIDLGITRILTSGCKKTAYEGKDFLRELVAISKGRIEILPGSGINFENAKEIVEYTGVNQIHFSAKESHRDLSTLNNSEINFAGSIYKGDDIVETTSLDKISQIINLF